MLILPIRLLETQRLQRLSTPRGSLGVRIAAISRKLLANTSKPLPTMSG